MAQHTWGWETDPRRDGCDSCQDLRNELEVQSGLLNECRAELERLREALEYIGKYSGKDSTVQQQCRAALSTVLLHA